MTRETRSHYPLGAHRAIPVRRARPRRQTPCFRWQRVLNLRPPTWKSQAQTTGPPRRVSVFLSISGEHEENG
ncbi:hypothetical protein H5410_000166 [Solanum commersonii]|uniref:Uncharacterized protein n=1 Tax=Solanum commersonii TaxID=4109 RepID=A0A9J6AVQ7_SOLCO|nr:hypothetical protein H5410_000166 [Solanum commersonii]